MGWKDAPVVQPNAQPAWASAPLVEAPREDPQPQESGLPRALALGGRATGEGVINALAMPADAQTMLQNAITHAVGKLFGIDIAPQPTISEMASGQLDQLGAYKPETDSEKVGYEAFKGMTGALASGGAAGLGSTAAGLTSLAASGALGGAAPETVRQAGGGKAAQIAAGVAASLLPGGSRAAVGELGKRLARGGEAGRLRTAENIKAFEDAGATPSMGQATESRHMQAAESLLSKAPGGAGVMAKRGQQQAADLGANIERKAAGLAPKSSAEDAGRAIQRGISGDRGFIEQFNDRARTLYDELDNYIQSDTPVAVRNTRFMLGEMTRLTKGAEATSERLINPKIAQLAQDVETDAATGTLPYGALKEIRTRIGEEISGGALKSDSPTAELKKLYGALSQDLEAAAKTAGPRAEQAYSRANTYYRVGSKRIEILESVIDRNGGPEAVFKAATNGTKEGATTLRSVMQSLPKEQQKVVSATVLRRLGRAKAGQQDDLGETFSTETFLTNWNTMAPEAKAVLFNRYGPTFRNDMDNLAKVAANLRQGSQVFKNPSGTSQGLAQIGAIGAFFGALGSGNVGGAGVIAGGVVASNLAARLLTNPTAVRWLATKTKAPVSALPALISQLNRSDDPDLNELGRFLESQKQQDDKGNRQ